jgi:hypothetical protein
MTNMHFPVGSQVEVTRSLLVGLAPAHPFQNHARDEETVKYGRSHRLRVRYGRWLAMAGGSIGPGCRLKTG